MSSYFNLNFLKTRLFGRLEGNVWKTICPILLLGGILLIFVPLFSNSSPHLIQDEPMWTAFAQVLNREVVPVQKWFWGIITDRENAGLVMGQSYSLNIIFLWLFHFFFPVGLSVKIFVVFSVLSFSLSYYFVCRKFMHPFFAMIASVFILTYIFRNAMNGMSYSYLAIACGLLFWLTSIRFLANPGVKIWILSCFLLTMTIYAHPIGFIAAMTIWITLLPTIFLDQGNPHPWKLAGVYFLLPCVAFLLASPQIFAMLSSQVDIPGEPSLYQAIRNLPPVHWKEWLLKTVKLQYKEARHFDVLLFFIPIGLFGVWKKEPRLKWPACGMYITGIFLASKMILLLPSKPSIFLNLVQFSPRFVVYLQLVFLLVAGAGCDYLYQVGQRMDPQTTVPSRENAVFRFLILLTVSALCLTSVPDLYKQRQNYLMTLDTFERKEELRSLWKWISLHVDPQETRVCFEDTFGTYPWRVDNNKNHPLALTSLYTGINQVGGWCGFVSNFGYRYNDGEGGYLFGKHSAGELTKPYVAENLRLLNCRYLVANSPEITEFLDGAYFLKKAETIGTFSIFEYRNMSPAWAYKNDTHEKVDLRKISSRQYELRTTGQAGEKIQISLAYQPNWQARQNDTQIPILYNKALMQVALPRSGPQVIELVYRIEKMTPLLFAGGGVILLIIISLYISGTWPEIK
jgi:hypothetical protein